METTKRTITEFSVFDKETNNFITKAYFSSTVSNVRFNNGGDFATKVISTAIEVGEFAICEETYKGGRMNGILISTNLVNFNSEAELLKHIKSAKKIETGGKAWNKITYTYFRM